jgi:hypothetical protein
MQVILSGIREAASSLTDYCDSQTMPQRKPMAGKAPVIKVS